ncbi:calpain-B-like isoform X3 [Amphibalanus amphitrite]|uniref:calpain-B-like isoform X3 n=1 Tax=Amphibalanus amphitrite TaxID=1232801 RepID=UPI001C92322D|nr:calpain-B-like isoform X3 [Amphibalanus amphitrite]
MSERRWTSGGASPAVSGRAHIFRETLAVTARVRSSQGVATSEDGTARSSALPSVKLNRSSAPWSSRRLSANMERLRAKFGGSSDSQTPGQPAWSDREREDGPPVTHEEPRPDVLPRYERHGKPAGGETRPDVRLDRELEMRGTEDVHCYSESVTARSHLNSNSSRAGEATVRMVMPPVEVLISGRTTSTVESTKSPEQSRRNECRESGDDVPAESHVSRSELPLVEAHVSGEEPSPINSRVSSGVSESSAGLAALELEVVPRSASGRRLESGRERRQTRGRLEAPRPCRVRMSRAHRAAQAVPMNERGSGLRPRGTVQDFDKLRRECLRSGQLFEDPEFAAEDCSIFFSKSPPRPFDWLRPSEIVSNPQFISRDASRFDVQQGELGDCWLLAAVANLTLNKDLFAQIVPDNQNFEDEYAGIFHFRFWQYGRWVDVVVDDRLPTYNGQLVFMHSEDNNEFWSALLEKAYAKLHGSYESLKGGTTCEAMEDFSGGVTEMYDIDKAPDNLFQILLKADERKSLMGCSIEPDPNVLEAELSNGLIRGHAYSITKVCLADIETPRVSGQIPMVRVRNPWGNEAEWKGAFSDSSPEWQYIPEESRQEIGLTFDADGEFWMTYKDFIGNFQRLEICNLSPDSLEEDDEENKTKRWEMSVFEGAWVRGATAGGCRNYISTFSYNPQYVINLADPDEDDDEEKCTVIVALMQKNRRAQRKLGLDCLTIGFAIYHVPDPESSPVPLDTSYFRYNSSVARAPSFINLREVSCRFKLPPGSYCIVPSTFEPNEEGEFIIRVFSEKKNNMEENDQEVGPGSVDDSVKPQLEEESEYDQMVREFFNKIAGDDLEIDWMELKQVLDYALKKEFSQFEFEGFSKDTARSMIALMDVDNSGKLGLEEFKTLWSSIRIWKTVFKQHDADGTGLLSAFELRSALNEAGYRVNNNLLNSLMHRYGDKDGNVAFDDFMACAVKLKTCMEIFRDRDPEKTNQAIFSLEDWIEYNMYS